MESNIPYEEQIERYVSGKMSDTEKKAFEKQMEVDDTLAEEVRTTIKMKGFYLQMQEEEAMKKKIAALHEEVIAEDKVKQIGRRLGGSKIWYAAATVAILLGTSYFLFFQGPNYRDIAQGGVEDFYGNIRPLMDANAKYYFLSHEYSKSLELTKKEIEEASNDSIKAELTLIKALCETALDKPETSLETLNGLESKFNSYIEKCRIDLAKAIALLQLEKAEESKNILTTIRGEGICADAHERARKLLGKLE